MSPVLFDLCFALLTISAGIVTAGIISSIYSILTNKILKFSMLETEGIELFRNIALIIFCGPVMLLRNCYYGRVLENRPLPYVFGGAMLAASWGMITGLCVIAFTLSIAY